MSAAFLTAYYELIKACHVEKDGKFTLLEIMGGCGIVLYGAAMMLSKNFLGNRGNCPDVSGSDVRLCVPFSKIPCRPGDDCFFCAFYPGMLFPFIYLTRELSWENIWCGSFLSAPGSVIPVPI